MNNTTFMGLEIAMRGLYSSQRAMANIAHNIDNVNTPGYSRQVVNQTSARPLLVANGAGMLGMGSDVVSVDRVRDIFLDEKYWSEAQYLGEWSVKATIIEDMQTIYNEPSDYGYTKIISDFYSSLQSLTTDPSSLSTRALVKEKGVAVAKYFNSVAVHFDHLQEDLNNMVNAKVEEINNIADQIRELNLQIYHFEVMGNKANDLRDHRGYLVDKLSRLVNCSAYEVETGLKLPNGEKETRFVVTISGKALVDHEKAVHLKCESRETKLNEEDIENLYEVSWADGNKLQLKSGELKAYIDMRDGNDGIIGSDGRASPNCKGIPYYQRKMNEFVRTFALSFNEGIIDTDGDGVLDNIEGHVDGFTLSGNTGIRFFAMLDEYGQPISSTEFEARALDYASKMGIADDPTTSWDERLVAGYQNITARNFSISFDIEENPSENIAASSNAGEAGNNENINKLLAMRHNTYMFMEGAPEDFIKTVISSMGVDGQQYNQYLDVQEGIVMQIDNRRHSISGVSLNEEMTNLVKHQQIYGAAAAMIQSYSEILDILVNRMGI
ncbi:MAG TPA: flagellar hook-associated protein FlgK [Clostridiaceae bacterium]|jgi:flagellar hook-associated protein 1 FlgK|nr:flagellar hook-associated protein FlgK [Clostridiaceae bacterium]